MKINLRFIVAILAGTVSYIIFAGFLSVGALFASAVGANISALEIFIRITLPSLLLGSLIAFAISGPTYKSRIQAAITTFIGAYLFFEFTMWMRTYQESTYIYLYNILFYEIPHFFTKK